jgi:phosphotransferase system HPr (HPr) family protein
MPEEVVRRQIRVANPDGLHVRPAANLVRLANGYTSDIRLVLGNKRLDAKSMIELMTMAAPQGTELVLEVIGSDALAAANAIEKLFAEEVEDEGTNARAAPG